MKLLVALNAILLCSAQPATAAIITFDTSQSQFHLGSDNQGWWSSAGGNVEPNDNYGVATSGSFEVSRNYFTFDLSSLDLTRQTIVGATLEVARYVYVSPDPSETLGLFDVSTGAATLNGSAFGSVGVFTDLGSGTSYGTFVVPTYTFSDTETLSFVLNSAAMADITGSVGGFFSIGGALLSGGAGTRSLFFGSDSRGIQRLTIETASAPEPASLALLGMVLAMGGRAYRRRRGPR